MKKINLNETYGYEDFITEIEKNSLLNWCNLNLNKFLSNGKGRNFFVIKENEEIYPLVKNLKEKIIELENINDWLEEPTFGDYIGINYENASIHVHSDPNINGYIHTRYNIILKYPENGGHSIYNNKINELKENLVWKCVAGVIEHGSTPVIGNRPRITLSLGFQIKDKMKIEKTLF